MEREVLDRIEKKLDKIDDKLDIHLERIAIVEEKEKTDRGSMVLLFSAMMTVMGWLVYKLLV